MLQCQKVAAVVVAGGSSRRMGFDKLMAPLGSSTVLETSVAAFAAHPLVDEIVVVASAGSIDSVRSLLAGTPKVAAIVPGGAERAQSVAAGVAATDAAWLAIHDGARPFVSADIITGALQGAVATGCAAPAVPVKDTVKRTAPDGTVLETPERASLYAVQTPQVVRRDLYLPALAALAGRSAAAITDDCMVMEAAGHTVRLTAGSYANRKITTPEDLPAMEKQPVNIAPALRIGHGYDVHRLVEERALILGGVKVPYELGLLGHSDADVLTHAVADALLGALALGDIGKHFPDTDPAWAGADSIRLLQHVAELIGAKGWRVGNIDATVLCQRPKLAPHISAMRKNLAAALAVEVEAVSVKATTEEKLGFTGAGQGIAAHCVALLVQG